jgi:uncharacterized protein YqhQ
MSVTLGGMALRDGVLLQSEQFWAAAVRNAAGEIRVASGRKARLPRRESLQHVPVARGLLRLGESLAVLPAVRRATGAQVLPQEDPRMLAATAVSAVTVLALRGSRRGSPLLKELIAAGASLAPVLLLLRDSRLSRYHGAEHKSVAAYESGIDSSAASKEHVRCGSNLIAPMMVTSLATSLLLRAAGKERSPVATLVAGLASIGTAMELFSWMAHHQDHPVARALRLPGLEMQRMFTTSEPSEDQLDVADLALQELLRLEGTSPAAD